MMESNTGPPRPRRTWRESDHMRHGSCNFAKRRNEDNDMVNNENYVVSIVVPSSSYPLRLPTSVATNRSSAMIKGLLSFYLSYKRESTVGSSRCHDPLWDHLDVT